MAASTFSLFSLCACMLVFSTRALSVVQSVFLQLCRAQVFQKVFFCFCWCEDRCCAGCLSVKINSNVKWQSESLRIGVCCLSPLRSMALSFTASILVHCLKIDMCVSVYLHMHAFVQLVSEYFVSAKVESLFIKNLKKRTCRDGYLPHI